MQVHRYQWSYFYLSCQVLITSIDNLNNWLFGLDLASDIRGKSPIDSNSGEPDLTAAQHPEIGRSTLISPTGGPRELDGWIRVHIPIWTLPGTSQNALTNHGVMEGITAS